LQAAFGAAELDEQGVSSLSDETVLSAPRKRRR